MNNIIYVLAVAFIFSNTSYSKLYWTDAAIHCENLSSKKECMCNEYLAVPTDLRNEVVLRQIDGTDTIYTRLNGQPCEIVHKWKELNFDPSGFQPIKY